MAFKKMQGMQNFKLYAILILLTGSFMGCSSADKESNDGAGDPLREPQVSIDLEKILERDTLHAITAYSSTSYFIYRGKQMGYEYELLNRFADYLGVELNIKLSKNLDELFRMLNTGEGDLIAYNLTVTQDRKKRVAFSTPHNYVKQVLVQQKPDRWRYMRTSELNDHVLRNPVNLDKDTVWVRRNSAYYERLVNLEQEIGGEIHIKKAEPDVETEELIKKVAEGEIQYTVADENIARINQTYYDNLDVSTKLSFPQKIAWAVRKNSPKLLDTLNHWINSVKGTRDYNVIYNKYYKNRKASEKRMRSAFFTATSNQLSQFDPLFKKYSEQLPYDWLLLASLSYQESHFNPNITSWAGAKGLMQLMPATAKQYGITNLTNPENSVIAGVKYLKWLDQDIWGKRISDVDERKRFVLASYNAGPGHVMDARRLTEKYDGNPNKWKNVSEFLLKKSNPKYYNDAVVKYGYCRGSEPYKYVSEILTRYKHYKRFLERTDDIQDAQAAANQSANVVRTAN